MDSISRNRLAGSTSPYLEQHAGNPVDWWPWCDEALALARKLDRPILLSIGYSACHWCHVMAHESFEDPETAALMNRLFVNIKVDREERPDLDRIYQTAHQLLARRPGGWPLTVFLTPGEHSPIFAGTYFPPQPRHSLPSFRQLLQGVAQAWQEQRDAIGEQGAAVMEALQQLEPRGDADAVLTGRPLALAIEQLASHYDRQSGGFGGAPKFPHPTTLSLLLESRLLQDNHEARQMALETLRQMADGGIQDHLGGGFYRYSVDDHWRIPHFEKMLYDNALLLPLYATAWRLTGEASLHEAAESIAGWVMREMQAPAGGYYSSLDADSDGEEGRFYLWDRAEIAAQLEPEEYRVFAPAFGLERTPNFEGRWHLYRAASDSRIAAALGLAPAKVATLLASARHKLFNSREHRARPGRDDKILCSWNALMVRGMARAGRLLNRPDWIDSAARAAGFLRLRLWHNGRLHASARDERVELAAYLDDHAYLIDALLELLQCRWSSDDLELARQLAERLLEGFADPANGGFFFTASDHERLLHRGKPLSDDAVPSGNGIAALALARLGHLLNQPRYSRAALSTLRLSWPSLGQAPSHHPSLLLALEEELDPAELLILRATPADAIPWLRHLRSEFQPRRLIFTIPAATAGLPEALALRRPLAAVTLYRYRRTSCGQPITEMDQLADPIT